MFKRNLLKNSMIAVSLISISTMSLAEDFKRFSVSAGWLHIGSQGSMKPFRINTGVEEGKSVRVGDISGDTIRANLDQERVPTLNAADNGTYQTVTMPLLGKPSTFDYLLDINRKKYENDPEGFQKYLTGMTGTADVYGLSSWQSNAGLEVKDIDTVGLMFDYYVNDHVSLQVLGGIPPEVDLKGKGQVYAPFSATGHPLNPQFNLYLKKDFLITDLDNFNTAASARAWTPGLQAMYHFGKTGENKFRPFVGAGVMVAHYTDIKLNSGVKNDLIDAGHMIQNIYDGNAGAALERKASSSDIRVKATADDAIAPMLSLGFNYDLNSNWYASGSISYAKLDNKTDITVTNKNTGEQLIHASTKIDVDPLITYVGIGYRF